MNGDSRETGKLTPEGLPDPSVFSTEHNREGIRVGTAVCVMVRKGIREKKPVTRFRHFWGVAKRAELLKSPKTKRFDAAYIRAAPDSHNRLSFFPESVAEHYKDWPTLTDLCAIPPSNGLMEKRGGALIDVDCRELEVRMRDYLDRKLSWEDYKRRHGALTENAAAFNASAARTKALQTEAFDADRIRRYALRPFDTRWCYYTSVNPVWNRPRPKLWAQCWKGNSFLMARRVGVAAPEGVPVCFTRAVGDNDALRGHAYYFPLKLMNGERLSPKQQDSLFDLLGDFPEHAANLSSSARAYLRSLRFSSPDWDKKSAALTWMHSLAIAYSPMYLLENADGVRRDWPRIPLPSSRSYLYESGELGEQIAALLDTETHAPGVTIGKIGPAFKTLGLISKTGRGAIDPTSRDLAVTAGWGHAGKDGVTMPGKGALVERAYSEQEVAGMEAEAKARGMKPGEVICLLGERTFDVYLNETVYWRNVPQNVWNYYIGGYQVIKKWLSYREEKLLGRPITPEVAREVTNMVRRIAGIILLQPQLDQNYQRVKESPFDWQSLAS